MRRVLIFAAAALCIVLGLLTVALPLPTGIPLLALGAFLIVANSRRAASRLKRLRQRVRWLDDMIGLVEDRAGPRFARPLRRTRPCRTGGVTAGTQKSDPRVPQDSPKVDAT